MIVEKQMECRLEGETEVLGENLPNVTFFYYLVCEAIGTAVTPGLLCQPRVIVKMILEKQMECRNSRRKRAPTPLLSYHKIPHDQTRV
jgi:hypothetical protein